MRKWISPNHGERAGGAEPSLIILHYTGMATGRAALERLCNPVAGVSAHYFIEESGKTRALVPESRRAWHAGQSYWDGKTDINSRSIGIEIVNPGHSCGYCPFPGKQIRAVARLCKKLVKKYGTKPWNVLGHSDVAPERKTDPGELFPWRELAEGGVGIWPEPQDADYQAAADIVRDKSVFVELLAAYGYDPQADHDAVIRAFHRHFYPEKIIRDDNPAQPDILSAVRILALLRTRHGG